MNSPSNTQTSPVPPFRPLSKEDAADVLGVSTRHLEYLVERGLAPRWKKMGGRSLYHPDVFYSWLDAYLKSDDDEPAGMSQVVLTQPKALDSGKVARAGDARRLARIRHAASPNLSRSA